MTDQPEKPLPWERPGYGFSGPLDPLHDTKINASPSKEMDILDRALPDLGASAVVFAREDGSLDHVSLDADAPEIDAEDLQLIRQQHPHLR